MGRLLSLIVTILLLGGSARAADVVPANYRLVVLEYRGTQEKPVNPVVIGDSVEGVEWYDATYINNTPGEFLLVEKHVADSSTLQRLVRDVSRLPPDGAESRDGPVGAVRSEELSITVVEQGAMRSYFTHARASDDIMRELMFDSRNVAALYEAIRQFQWGVYRYNGAR